MSYVHELLPGPTFIRILTLQPAGQYTDPIICTIELAELKLVQDQYDALSYS